MKPRHSVKDRYGPAFTATVESEKLIGLWSRDVIIAWLTPSRARQVAKWILRNTKPKRKRR